MIKLGSINFENWTVQISLAQIALWKSCSSCPETSSFCTHWMKRESFLKTVISCKEKHNYARAVFIWVCVCLCECVSREWSALGWICPHCFDISWLEPSRPWQSCVLRSSLPFNAYWIQIIFVGSAEFSIGRSDPLTIYKLEFTRKRKSEVMVRVWSLRHCIQRKKTFGFCNTLE